MAFCSNCGKELNSGARFCDGCGTPASGAENKRNTVFEGDIHKCPHCGEVLNSFVVNCPSCGYELRDVQSQKEIRIFNSRLNKFYDRNEKIDFIREYPIPNSKEAIWEFVNLASANIASYDRNGDGTIDKNEQAYIDAWRMLQNRCRDKAKKIYAIDSCEMKEIEELISKSEKILNEGLRKTKAKKVANVSTNILALLGRGIHKIWKTKVGKIILILLALAVILTISILINDVNGGEIEIPEMDIAPKIETIVWSDLVLGGHIPIYEVEEGEIVDNTSKVLHFRIYEIDKEKVSLYVNVCKDLGYTIEAKQGELYYEAYKESGYKLTIDNNDLFGYISIRVDAPIESSNIIWPNSELLNGLPKPKSNQGYIDLNSSEWFEVYITNTTYDEYVEYVNQCMNKGYNIDYSWISDNTYFSAKNKEGTDITISYEGFNTIRIKLFNVDY